MTAKMLLRGRPALLLLATASVCAHYSPGYSQQSGAVTHGRADDPRLEGGQTVVNFEWLTLLYDAQSNSAVGNGVVWNYYWLVTTSFAVAAYSSSSKNLLVYSGVMDVTDLTGSSVVKRRARHVLLHDSIVNSENALALVKVCPSFADTQFTTVRRVTPSPGDFAYLISYSSTNIEMAMKFVGDNSACSTIPNWNAQLDFCLENDISTFVTSTDLAGVVVRVDEEVAGFVTAPQLGAAGEIVIDLTKYKSWIDARTA